MIEYVLVGVLAPVFLNILHLLVGLYIVIYRGSIMSLGFTGIGFLTKSMAMIFLTWLGVGYLGLDMKIFIPLLAFFSFFTHIVEAFVIQHYMKENQSKFIKSIQL